jgi:hypothetical protein
LKPPSGWYPPEGQEESMASTSTPSIQSSAPAISLTTLRAVLAEMEVAHPERASRLVRAANIVAIRRITLGDSGKVWWVQSECDATQEYMVVPVPDFGLMTCTCRDFQQRGGPCKHALSVQMLQACEARERGPQPPPTPLAFPQRAYADDERFELTEAGASYLAALDASAAA